jgi:predicted acyltransferase
LQRIALCYCIASLLVYFFKTRTVVIISIALLLLYWAVSVFFGDAIDPFQMTTNAGYKLDVLLIGENHLYHGEGIAFDPEGLTSTLPAIVNVTAGYFVGLHLQRTNKSYEGLTKLLLAGFALIATAYFWNFIFPINKKLWTSSFVLQTVGLDCLILGTIIFIMDKRPNAKWPRFFEIAGKNPLAIYLFSELLAHGLEAIHVGETNSLSWVYEHSLIYLPAYWNSLLFAIAFMLLCWGLGYWMDKKKIYFRA